MRFIRLILKTVKEKKTIKVRKFICIFNHLFRIVLPFIGRTIERQQELLAVSFFLTLRPPIAVVVCRIQESFLITCSLLKRKVFLFRLPLWQPSNAMVVKAMCLKIKWIISRSLSCKRRSLMFGWGNFYISPLVLLAD